MESLAVKYRPKHFEDVLGQSIVVDILKKQLETNTFKNSYLFYGPSGCGKTTLAKIFANEINKGIGNPIEIDAASNSGVDNVRDIIKLAQERSIEGEYKIFIIDEVHAISSAAWQAFLKCIEEPPTYTIFIFCTTEIQKVPQTIQNRVQSFKLNKIDLNDLKLRLTQICDNEGFYNYEDSIDYIAKLSNGCCREAISMLDKCVSFSKDLKFDNVIRCLGDCSYNVFFNLTNSIIDNDEKNIINILEHYYNEGNDFKQFVDQYIKFCFDIVKYIIFKSFDNINIPTYEENNVKNIINIEGAHDYYLYIINKLLELKNNIKIDNNIKDTVEINFIKISRGE